MDAQFLSIRDGKIHLHKTNGVKIAVPISKMSMQDLRYVEAREGISLDEDKPLSELMKQRGAGGQRLQADASNKGKRRPEASPSTNPAGTRSKVFTPENATRTQEG